MAFHIRILITAFFVLLLNNTFIIAWGGNDKVLLKDIDVLTLYNGKMTKGSRSSPVLQLECVEGGTAPCNTFKPRVVQCYNRGSDGADVQWECKTDMDNAYRFGSIEVSCEGYSYPDDPYVLKGSCGLRYNIDYTMEGNQQKKQHDYYGDSQSSNHYGSNDNNNHNYYNTKSSKSWNFADIIVLGAVGLMIYAFYVTCIRPSRHVGEDANSTTNEDYPSGGGGGGYGWQNPSAPPPPGSGGGGGGGGTYGFNTDYTSGASCGGGRNRSNHSSSANGASGASGSGGGGFWTGAATGGLLGYMFGNRGNNRSWTGGATGYGGRGFGGGGFGGGGFGGGGFSRGGGGFSGGSSSSSGTRSSSGFGGTSRR